MLVTRFHRVLLKFNPFGIGQDILHIHRTLMKINYPRPFGIGHDVFDIHRTLIEINYARSLLNNIEMSAS